MNGLGYGDGAGTRSAFNFPSRLTIDMDKNVYIADTGNHVIRKVSQVTQIVRLSNGKEVEQPAGTVLTIAGQPEQFGYADGYG